MLHTFVSGESLSSVAKAYGLQSWQALYNAPENQTFRLRFPNPNMVPAGAKIEIPKATATVGPPKPLTTNANTKAAPKPSVMKAPVAKTNGQKPFNPDAEPDVLTADIIKGAAFDFPAKFVEFLCRALQVPESDFKSALDFLKKKADGVDALIDLYKAYKAYEKGDTTTCVTCLFKGFAKAWSILPAGTRGRAINGISKICGRIPKFGKLTKTFAPLDRIDAFSALLKMLAGFIDGGPGGTKDAMEAGKDLVKALRDNPGEAMTVAMPILDFLQDLIPERLKAKLLGKMAGKKVPVAGTIVVGIMDGISIISDPTDWKRWAGLGSTLVALVPIAGTAVSVCIDISVLIGTIAENIHDLNLDMGKAIQI